MLVRKRRPEPVKNISVVERNDHSSIFTDADDDFDLRLYSAALSMKSKW